MNFLPDIIAYNLTILFIGYNPGLKSSEIGHHYAGSSNSFWKLLFEAGLTPFKLKAEEDRRLLDFGYGSTNIVSRPSRSAAELKAAEYKEGAVRLRELLQEYKPHVACYVGIGVYKAFTARNRVVCGLQESSAVEGITDYVCPSTSGLNRMPYQEQLKYFKALKELANEIDISR